MRGVVGVGGIGAQEGLTTSHLQLDARERERGRDGW